MPPELLARFRRMIQRPHGMILVTGPTGSGKTTTLYGALSELNRPEVKIITAEDPVEYRLPRVTQVQVNPKIGLEFSDVLRAALRQDPDVILVGEMRDSETVEIGLRAAMTGHLVLSTLHTNDSISSAMRLIDMGAEPFLVASSLLGVVAQRLVRRVCENCAEPYQPTEQERIWLESFELDPVDLEAGFVQGRGCYQCSNTGYKGRVGVYEMLEMNEAMLDALRRRDVARFTQAARQSPLYRPLGRCAMDYALRGITSLGRGGPSRGHLGGRAHGPGRVGRGGALMEFLYRGRDAQGGVHQGTLVAVSAEAAAAELMRKGITPLTIRPRPASPGASDWRQRLLPGRQTVTLDELIVFCRQMYALTRAGIPLIRTMRGLAETTRSPALARVLDDVTSRLEGGTTMATAMKAHPAVFSDLFVAMIHVGENTGMLDESFKRLSDILELERDTRRRLKQAMRYPTFVLVALLAALMIVNFLVIPKFAAVFDKLGADLPVLTQVLVGTSEFLLGYWYVVLFAVAGAAVLVRQWLRTPGGRLTWDRYKLRLPGDGQLAGTDYLEPVCP